MSDSPQPPEDAAVGFKPRDLLLLLPFIWQLGLAPWANEVEARPFGLPFIMFWQMAGIVFASIVLYARYRMDRRLSADADTSAEGGAAQ